MIYSGGNELLSKLFDEVSVSIGKEHIGNRIYNLKLKSDLLFYKDKFKIKSQNYTWYDGSKIEYHIFENLHCDFVYPIKNITLDHKIELEIDDDIALQFLLEIR